MTPNPRFVATLVGLACGLALGWWAYPHLAFDSEEALVPFSHALHTGDDVGMACVDCHDHGAGRAMALPTVTDCADCHDGIPGLALALDDPRLPARPWNSALEQPEGVRFSHPQHVDLAQLACATCHGDHATTADLPPLHRNRISTYVRALWGRSGLGPATTAAGMEMSDCVRCHDQHEVVQSCLDCHR